MVIIVYLNNIYLNIILNYCVLLLFLLHMTILHDYIILCVFVTHDYIISHITCLRLILHMYKIIYVYIL